MTAVKVATVELERALVERLLIDLAAVARWADEVHGQGDMYSPTYEEIMAIRGPLAAAVGIDSRSDDEINAMWDLEAERFAEMLRDRAESMLARADEVTKREARRGAATTGDDA